MSARGVSPILVAAFGAAAVWSAGCRASGNPIPDVSAAAFPTESERAASTIEQWPPDEPPPPPHAALDRGWHEWFSLAVGTLHREGTGSSVVGDGLIWTFEGGYEYVRPPLRIGPEIGLSWSSQDLDSTVAPGEDPDLDILRFAFGGRVSVDLGWVGTTYVRGGIYTRDEESHDVPGFEDDSNGKYWGAGFEFWFDPRGRLGPYVRWYDSNDSDLEERSVGFAATFIL